MRAGVAGVVQQVMVEDGEQVQPGANVARVARPDELQAELRVAETQASDVVIGQVVDVDTRNGMVAGKVTRIDPAVNEGTVQVDVELTGELPRGARPDQSVDGTIEIERLANAVHTGRPDVRSAELHDQAVQARRRRRVRRAGAVELGRTSVNAVEIVQGWRPATK